jgi:hypothetical protein
MNVKELNPALLSTQIKSKRFIAIAAAAIIASSTLVWFMTTNSNFFHSFISGEDSKDRQDP